MSDAKPPKETHPDKARNKSQADLRAAALEKALRENLRRRKASAGPQTETASARRATDAQPPSRSEALGQEKSLHEKAKEIPEDGA